MEKQHHNSHEVARLMSYYRFWEAEADRAHSSYRHESQFGLVHNVSRTKAEWERLRQKSLDFLLAASDLPK